MARRVLRAAFGLALVLSLALLGACGGGANPGASGGAAGGASGGGAGGSEAKPFAGQTLVVTSYSGSWEDFMKNTIIPPFEEETGATVQLAVGLTSEWMAKLRAAGKDNPPYDVVIGNETYISGTRADGFFTNLPLDKVPNLEKVAPQLRNKDDNGVLGLLNPLGIVYRTDLVNDPPTSWKDLWKPAYKGQICLYSAKNSAMPMVVMNTARVFAGDPTDIDTAFEKLKELKPFKMADFTGDIQQLLTLGECSVAVLDSPTWAQMYKKGVKVAYVVPSDGLFTFEQDMNVTSGSKVKDLAFAFINYMLSTPVQTKWAENFYATPANVDVPITGELATLIPVTKDNLDQIHWWDWNWVNSGAKQTIIDRWNKEIAGQ